MIIDANLVQMCIHVPCINLTYKYWYSYHVAFRKDNSVHLFSYLKQLFPIFRA